MDERTMPEGYMEDVQGRLVPLSKVDPIDRARDELVRELVERARATRESLRRTKAGMMGDIAAFVSLSAEEHGVRYGGQKGNVSLLSYDGRYKVVRSMADAITFDERIHAARELINECLRDWTEGSSENLRAVVDAAFDLDREGRMSAGRILGLRRIKVDDPRWRAAMEAISDSVQIVGNKPYVRVYERGEDGKFAAISMDMAAV